ncbi:MAG: hypothetical protein QOK37_3899 [Thermoanaerobaculia bacterium]|jgi:hypothetical protein|nr:hypothetical protein [Thermoanaerobaculia bacterium]
MRNLLITLVLAILPPAAIAQVHAADTTLTVTIEPARITATGVSPGSQVLFFGSGFEPKAYHVVTHRWSAVVSDTRHSGTVSYELDKPVTWNALWIVADLRNGHYAIAATPGYAAMRSDLTDRKFRRDNASAVSQFSFSRLAADFLYIAPGGGAWNFLARDGDANDADGVVNGETTIDLLRANPVDGTERQRQFSPGGTLFVIDPMRLDLLELKLNGAMLAGAR